MSNIQKDIIKKKCPLRNGHLAERSRRLVVPFSGRWELLPVFSRKTRVFFSKERGAYAKSAYNDFESIKRAHIEKNAVSETEEFLRMQRLYSKSREREFSMSFSKSFQTKAGLSYSCNLRVVQTWFINF